MMAGNPNNLDSMTSKQPNIVDGKYGLDSSIWFKGNLVKNKADKSNQITQDD